MPAIHDRAKVNGDDVAFLQRALPRHAMHDLFIDGGADDASEWRCTLGGRVALEIRGRATTGKLACGQGIEFTRRHAWLRRRAQDLQNLHHHQACLPDTLDLSFTAIVDCHTLLRLPRAHVYTHRRIRTPCPRRRAPACLICRGAPSAPSEWRALPRL